MGQRQIRRIIRVGGLPQLLNAPFALCHSREGGNPVGAYCNTPLLKLRAISQTCLSKFAKRL